MLGIAKKVYNGVTDQRVFRLLVLVSMFFAYMELTKIHSTLNGIEYDTERLRSRTSGIIDELSQIEFEAELIRDYAKSIRNNTY
tara:strand:- start:2415 stop:2666 length:252 start_codon:yes stop_codon:yes gene_type:complete